MLGFCRKEGQDTTDEVRKRDLRAELEDRERRHFSSKDRSYGEVHFKLFGASIFKAYLTIQISRMCIRLQSKAWNLTVPWSILLGCR